MIKLHNIALALEYNSNLILLGQFCKRGIIYYNNPIIIILMRKKNVITEVKRKRNFFILNLANLKKNISVISLPNNIRLKNEIKISILSIYVDNFFLTSNLITILGLLK